MIQSPDLEAPGPTSCRSCSLLRPWWDLCHPLLLSWPAYSSWVVRPSEFPAASEETCGKNKGPCDLPGPETHVQVLAVLELSSHLFSLSLSLLLDLVTPGDYTESTSARNFTANVPPTNPTPRPQHACAKHTHTFILIFLAWHISFHLPERPTFSHSSYPPFRV